MRLKMRYILVGICLILCVYLTTFIKPTINLSAKINDISIEDYNRIKKEGQGLPKDVDIKHLKHVDIQVNAKAPNILIKDINFNSEGFYDFLRDNEKVRMLGESRVTYNKKHTEILEVYLENANAKDLREVIEDFKYIVSWKNIWNFQDKEIFYLKDYLK
ncbi:hypothetical protein IM33_00190 [Clostridioides difficile]|nr:hypothetical protein IM33_00190 [Clostridioides difficile]